MARALASQGLMLSLGFQHHNRYNAFCLVDDMMAPYRPFVDLFVWQRHQKSPYSKTLEVSQKEELLLLLHESHNSRPALPVLLKAIEHTALTLVRTLQKRRKRISWKKL